MTLILAVLLPAAVLAGVVAAISGFGIGSLLTPLLAIEYGTKTAILLVALPHFVATATRFWMLRRSVDRRVLLTFGAASFAGGVAGALLHDALDQRLLSIILGGLLIFAGISGVVGISRSLRIASTPLAVAAGIVSAAFGGLVGNQGGIRSAALLHFNLPRAATVATATGIGLAVDLARIPVYLATGADEMASHWSLIALASAGTIIGTLIGLRTLHRLPEETFRRLVFVLIIVLGVVMLAGVGG